MVEAIPTPALHHCPLYRQRGRHSRCSFTTSTTTPEPERADRISRLDGLGCITTARAGQQAFSSHIPPLYAPAYFENHATLNECSTVGSASATGSIAGRMTRASDSDVYDAGEISEDHDQGNGTLSVGSDEGNENPVRFGECANSTSSGPIPRPPGLKRVSSVGVLERGLTPRVARMLIGLLLSLPISRSNSTMRGRVR